MKKQLPEPSPFTKGGKKKSVAPPTDPTKPPGVGDPGAANYYGEIFQNMDLSQNPYQNVTNPYGDSTNPYGDSTNPWENATNTSSTLENPYTGQVNVYENPSNAYDDMGNVYSGMTNEFASIKNPWSGAQNKWADVKAQLSGMENQYLGLDNQYTNLKNQYAGMENVMEDMGVDSEAAEYAAQTQAQSRADIMSALSGAAGGSGISGLAQTLANQASQDARQSSVDISRQERENEKMRVQEESRIDQLQRGEQSQLEKMRAGEESRLDQLKAGEEAKIDLLQRQELGEIDRLERGGAERLQSQKLGSQMQLDMAKAQAQQGISMAEAEYAGKMDFTQRGQDQSNYDKYIDEQSRLQDRQLDWQSQQDRDVAAEDRYLQDQILGRETDIEDRFLDREASIEDKFLDTEFDIQKLMAEGDKYTQGLEMDRISALLQGSLGIDAAKRSASASKKKSSKGLIGSLVPVAKTVVTKGAMTGCIPRGICVDTIDGQVAVEDVKPGDVIVGYDGQPTKVLQKHEYLEDAKEKGWYKVTFKNSDDTTSDVVVSGCHKIMGERAQNITKNVVNKEIYDGVIHSYDLLTEDLGYRMNGIPVDSMIGEKAEIAVKLKEIIEKTRELQELKNN